MNKGLKLIKSKRIWLVAGLFILDGLFFGLTNPDKVASQLLVVGFLLCTATLYALLGATTAHWGRRGRRAARVATGLVAGLLALQSVGQLAPRDVLVLLPLTVVAYLYSTYGRTAAE